MYVEVNLFSRYPAISNAARTKQEQATIVTVHMVATILRKISTNFIFSLVPNNFSRLSSFKYNLKSKTARIMYVTVTARVGGQQYLKAFNTISVFEFVFGKRMVYISSLKVVPRVTVYHLEIFATSTAIKSTTPKTIYFTIRFLLSVTFSPPLKIYLLIIILLIHKSKVNCVNEM